MLIISSETSDVIAGRMRACQLLHGLSPFFESLCGEKGPGHCVATEHALRHNTPFPSVLVRILSVFLAQA